MNYNHPTYTALAVANNMDIEQAEVYLRIAEASRRRAFAMVYCGTFLIVLSVAVLLSLQEDVGKGLITLRHIGATQAEIWIACSPFLILGIYLTNWALILHRRAKFQVKILESAVGRLKDGVGRFE